MAIDDNTTYGLTGAQIKELPGKIEDVKGEAKILTSADYDFPSNNPTSVALWKLDTGMYKADADVSLSPHNSSTLGVGCSQLVIINKGAANTKIWVEQSTSGAISSIQCFQTQDSGLSSGNTVILTKSDVKNNLTSNSTDTPLSANQGRVLKDLIDNLPTGGGITELTSADYNYDPLNTGSNTAIALWMLAPGMYKIAEDNVRIYYNTNANELFHTGRTFVSMWEEETRDRILVVPAVSSDGLMTFYVTKANGTSTTIYNFLKSSERVQTTGTSTTDVMSQNAVTSMVFADPSALKRIRIGSGAQAYANDEIVIGGYASSNALHTIAIGEGATCYGNYNIALGYGAISKAVNKIHATAIGSTSQVNESYSVALGSYSNATQKGQVDISTTLTTNNYGYNNSQYRLLTGVYDPQSAHDAATKGYVDSAIIQSGTAAPTTSTAAAVGALMATVESGTGHLYICTDDTGGTYTWQTLV